MSTSGKNRRGALTFEWIVIIALLVIGLISGVGELRNSIMALLGDMTASVEALNDAASGT